MPNYPQLEPFDGHTKFGSRTQELNLRSPEAEDTDSNKSEVLKSDSMICGKRKRVQQEVPQTIVYSFGSIGLLERTLRSIAEDLSKAQASFNDSPKQDFLEIMKVFTSNIEAVKKLKTDFEEVVKRKN